MQILQQSYFKCFLLILTSWGFFSLLFVDNCVAILQGILLVTYRRAFVFTDFLCSHLCVENKFL